MYLAFVSFFFDFSKAFDKVSGCKLFNKLLDDKVDINIVRTITVILV